MICPCQQYPHQTKAYTLTENSSEQYKDCCQPFHEQTLLPQTAEQLMRSRYCAFVLEKIDYIIETTVPAQQTFLNKDSLTQFSTDTDWQGLTIVMHKEKVSKRHAQVEFQAFFNTPTGMQTHHELSTFVQIGKSSAKKWYFLDPTLGIKIPQKQPCICGSGEKFKRCCAVYL